MLLQGYIELELRNNAHPGQLTTGIFLEFLKLQTTKVVVMAAKELYEVINVGVILTVWLYMRNILPPDFGYQVSRGNDAL